MKASKMKEGKYVGVTFTPDQERARAIWVRQRAKRYRLADALVMPGIVPSREECHAKLDRLLDGIEKQESRARELFPEVNESFTIATMRMDW